MPRMGKAPITQVKSITQKVGGGVKKDSINRNLLVKKVTAGTKPTRDALKAVAGRSVPITPRKDSKEASFMRGPAIQAQKAVLKSGSFAKKINKTPSTHKRIGKR